jgi:hypothetical protein
MLVKIHLLIDTLLDDVAVVLVPGLVPVATGVTSTGSFLQPVSNNVPVAKTARSVRNDVVFTFIKLVVIVG